MLSKQRLLLAIFVISAVLSLSACTSNAQYFAPSPSSAESNTPMPTLFRFPEKDILPPPTLTTTEAFECWNASSSKISTRQDDLGQLLIAYHIDGSSTFNLYRFDFITRKHSLLASQIEAYAPSPDGLNIWYSFYQTSKRSLLDVVFVHDLADNTRRQVPFPIPIDSNYGQIAWSPDSQCLFAWRDDTAFAYRLKDSALQSKTFPGAKFGFNASAVSPDGRWGGPGAVRKTPV